MAGWLAAAEKLFRSGASQPLPPFELTCVCGRGVSGLRTKAMQTPQCPDCGISLFVMPASVYPPPRAPKRKLVVAAKPQAEFVPDQTAIAVQPDDRPPRVGKKNIATRLAHEQPAAEVREPPPAPRRPLKQVLREAVVALELDRHLRRIFSPVRLVLVGVVSVVALTGWWIVHQQDRDAAERMIVAGAKLGEQALAEHDLGEAARQFQKVRAALDLLGRSDIQARALRQTASETTAAAELVRSSLFDLLHDAVESDSGRSYLTWDETFRTSYRDEWVVLDAFVSRLPDSASGRHYDVDFPLTDGKHRAVIVADLDIFEKALSAGESPQRLIFAGQLDDCRKDPKVENTWRIVLRPATGFLWSSSGNLQLLGVAIDDGTKQTLADQTNILGIAQ